MLRIIYLKIMLIISQDRVLQLAQLIFMVIFKEVMVCVLMSVLKLIKPLLNYSLAITLQKHV